jgi:hypothetical protein
VSEHHAAHDETDDDRRGRGEPTESAIHGNLPWYVRSLEASVTRTIRSPRARDVSR